jgi:putative FmdB family regulatory protein
MPIYAYKCASCGHAKDVLQRMSDDPLTVCTACGAASFEKQVTSAGFQLKGSGWYVTDFKGGAPAAPAKATEGEGASAGAGAEGGEAKVDSAKTAKSETPAASASAVAPVAAAKAPAPATPASSA